jgi:hypothetical protein
MAAVFCFFAAMCAIAAVRVLRGTDGGANEKMRMNEKVVAIMVRQAHHENKKKEVIE